MTRVRLMTFALVVMAQSVLVVEGAPILLQDDFNDGVIDGAKWTVDTSATSGASVVEQNGKIEFQQRGFLITNVAGLDPAVDGPIKITGELSLSDGSFPDHDFLRIVTRSDGLPFGSFGEVKNGLAFTINGNNVITIGEFNNGADSLIAPQVPVQFDDGDTFAFEIIDTGSAVSFSVTEIGGQGATASVGANSSFTNSSKVAIYNREYSGNVATLDNFTIERVPEPSTLCLAITSMILGFALYVRRRYSLRR